MISSKSKIGIDKTIILKIKHQKDMDLFVRSLNLKSKLIIIKPNWVDALPGSHTDARILDILLTALARPAVILESYTFWRTDKNLRGEGDYFSSKEATLTAGFKHWEFYKKQDDWFLKREGLNKVLKKHNAKYINITNEIWSKRGVDWKKIKKIVELNYNPVKNKDLYSIIPKKVFDLRGADLISFSKAKLDSAYGFTHSIKNLFGLIPDPNRSLTYHGTDKNESLLVQSIIDINKIYQSLFKVKFVTEGVFNTGYMDWEKHKNIPIYNWGVILGGDDGYQVDNICSRLTGRTVKGPLKNLLKLYKKNFGGTDVPISQELKKRLNKYKMNFKI